MTQAPPAPSAPTTPPSTPTLAAPKGMPRMQEMGLVIVILALSLFLWSAAGPVTRNLAMTVKDAAGNVQTFPREAVTENGFLRVNNLVTIVFTYMSWMAIMAIGQTFVIISGGIDISVGSIMGLSALVTALVLQSLAPETSPAVALLLGIGTPLVVGTLCGLFNGALVVGLKMHPFIVTLATLSMFRWVCLKIGVTYGASLPSGDKVLPESFTDHFIAWSFSYARYGGRLVDNLQIVPILIMLVCLAAGWIYLRHMVWGRETYAIGGNEEAARFSGINVKWAKMRVYILSGLAAGIAGMLNCGFFRSAATDTGKGYELYVIAAAVVGGASLTGGRGTALGAVLGMLVLQLIEDGISVVGKVNLGFTQLKVVKEDQQLILGVAIIIAVAVDQLSMYLQSRRSARAKAAH